MLAKLLIGWGAMVIGACIALAIAVVLVESHERAGWARVAASVVVLSALPALVGGIWLKDARK